MVRHYKVAFWQTLLSKILPLIFTVPAFIMISPWTEQYRVFLTPIGVLYGTLMIYTGLALMFEMFYALPENNKHRVGIFGALLLAILSITSFIFGGAIYTGFYDVDSATSELNTILSILFGIAIVLFITQARYEIVHGRRLMEGIRREFGG